MEKWDLLDGYGNKTGKIIDKAAKLTANQYHLGVEVWIKNPEGEYLFQKRAGTKKRAPNMWMTTGGSVLSGENGIEAACREAFEELGIILNADRARMLLRVRFDDCINEVWLFHENIPLSAITIEPDEVSEVKWLTREEIHEFILKGQMAPYDMAYLHAVFEERTSNEMLALT